MPAHAICANTQKSPWYAALLSIGAGTNNTVQRPQVGCFPINSGLSIGTDPMKRHGAEARSSRYASVRYKAW